MPNTDRAPKTEPIKEPPFGTSGGLYYPSDGAHELGRHLGLDGGGIDALHTELRECYVRAKREGEGRAAKHHIASTPDTGGDRVTWPLQTAVKVADEAITPDDLHSMSNDARAALIELLKAARATTPTTSQAKFHARARQLEEGEWQGEVWLNGSSFAAEDQFPNHDKAWEWAEWHRAQFQRVLDLATQNPASGSDGLGENE